MLREYSKQNFLHQNDDAEIWLATHEDMQVIERIFYQKSDLIEVYRTLLSVHQENLLEILDVWETDTGFTVIEEYIEGVPISELMMGGKIFTQKECRSYALQLCASLKVLHEKQIVHRDIKPGNIMICETGTLKLIDFSAARFFDVCRNRDTRLLGTEGYAAPEQYGFSQTDFRTDFYALGVTIREMLGPQSSLYFRKILTKCTRLDPSQRYQSIDELKNALKNVYPWKKTLVTVVLLFSIVIALENFWIVWREKIVEKMAYSLLERTNSGSSSQSTISEELNDIEKLQTSSNPSKPIIKSEDILGRLYSLERKTYLLKTRENFSDNNPNKTLQIPNQENISGNILNGNYIHEYDGWTYLYFKSGIWRIKNDDSVIEQVFEDLTGTGYQEFQIQDQWLYLNMNSNPNGDIAIWRINLNSGEGQNLKLAYRFNLNVVNDWIYYLSSAYRSTNIVRVRTDGSNMKVIRTGRNMDLIEEKGWLYFQDEDNEKICRMRTDGSDFQSYNFYSTIWCIDNGWIYYQDFLEESRDLWRVPVEGGTPEKLIETNLYSLHIRAFNIQDNKVYFSAFTNKGGDAIYQINTDGTELKKLWDTEETADEILLANGWIYYRAHNSDLIRRRIDGSYQEKIEEIMPTA